ncbi:S-layer homology domain-containing protein [Bacillus sp. 3255]|uniref:S-layer homology domain-containing protein n=1 Tax=Bacillus sp. 3255 TaxID=2817904 RepID=UPI0028621394|nr:S-layer homology domain-containing protein [Bacillus sp. 3255]MDR6878845.1 hypothetical protein [Bacillus sp. 3255]
MVESIPLNPGSNSITIKVTDTDGASAEYELTVIRDAGTAGYPHRITSAEQLASIGNLTEGYKLSDFYRLDADLNLAAAGISNWSPIGSSVTPFNGVFDGNHHTIANVTISQPSADEVGFFGRTNSAQLHDFALVNVQVTGRDHVGGLIGYAEDTPVSSVSVQGAVYGQDHAGGLIGTLIAATPSSGLVDYSFSAAYVSAAAGSSGGLIGTTTVADVVTHSFWDMATSGQAITYGGGLGKTTNDLMTKSTFTAGGWQFGSGHSWEIIDGTGYPTPLATFAHLTLSGLTLSTPGSSNSMRGFQSGTGLYSPSLSTPVGAATILATPSTPDATVTFNGTSSNNVALTLGSNPVLIRVTSPDGISQGLYRMNINVPTPEIQSLQVPSNGTYGLGEPMDFTVTYTQPVTISGTPVLPLHLAGTDVNAVYTGQPAGQPTKLKFRYIVQTGDTDPNGIEVGTALSLAPSATITSIGQDVPLTIAGVPSLSGIVIDGIVPAILSVPATTTPTNGPITVNVTADGTGSALTSLKWAAGTHPASYFTSSGTVVTAGAFQVTDNGTYTIYAKDAAGNTAVSTLEITNIITQNPSMLLDFNPKELVHTGVDVTVTAEAADAGTGNAIADLQWAEGARSAADFAAPGFGTAIPLTGSFHVTHNGTYTVYAIDMAGNQKVETITIANIVTQLPVIALDYTPKSIGVSSVTLTVTASVYEEGTGNTLNSLRWARGDLAISSFADPAFGTDVPASGLIPVTQNGKYTVYASDLAGNEQAVVIEITNMSEASNSDSAAAPAAPVTPPGQFYVEPGKAYTFTFEGLTVQIPAGAVKVPTTITVKRAGTDAQQLITQGQALLSEAYRLTKDVTGKFAVPISLTFTADLSKEKRPAVFYYDEATKQWTKLPSKAEGSLITGETDHFTLFAVLPAAESKPLVLSDITGHWAEQIIRSSAAQGWISGYPDGTFLPNRAVSRAEFAVLLSSVLHLPAGQSLPFADASSIPAWASPAVASAVQAGILSGYEDRTFRPDVSITRTEATVMIAKAAGLAETQAAATGFADDARIAGWAKGWIASALSAKLVQGQAGNAFQPQASTTRAEAVVLLQRLAARQP